MPAPVPKPNWRFLYEVTANLPPLAWLARVEAPQIVVRCGMSVRHSETAFFEGTWAGTGDLESVARSTTVFGSGMALAGEDLLVITPAHTHEGVYAVRDGTSVSVSNSIVALLVEGGLDLDPDVPYPTIMCDVARLKLPRESSAAGLMTSSRFTIPARPRPLEAFFYENVRVDPTGDLGQVSKPREPGFDSFADYRARLIEATRSLFANGRPYEPVVALSAGYDSTAVAAVAAPLGCRRALSLTTGRSFDDGSTIDDSGAAIAKSLGLQCDVFDRLGYRQRDDLIEADFLASGVSGEDLPFSSFEPALNRTILLTGFWQGELWVKSRHYPRPWLPGDFAGCSLTEFRLRADFYHVPLPCFAMFPVREPHPFVDDPDMLPFSVGGEYDRAIPRRLAEEAGVPRGTFALTKQAATMLLHRSGRASFAPATAAAIERFAAPHPELATFKPLPRPGRASLAVVRLAYALRVPRLAAPLERRRQLAKTFEPRFGTLLFRWAVSVVRDRYRVLEPPQGNGTTG